MKKKKISVIVSAYNTEEYVRVCLNSLIQQTFSNLEILCIDDGSTDHTLNVLQEYAKKDSRIQVFENKENKGLSYSRNFGLKKSSGDYISFIDSDDYVDENFYESLLYQIEEESAQIAVCDIKSIDLSSHETFVCEGFLETEESPLSYINTGYAASACNKLFCKNIIQKYSFPVGKINEDVSVILPILVEAEKICYVKGVYYYYIKRGDSIQNQEFQERRFDIFDGVRKTLELIQEKNSDPRIRDAILFQQIILFFFYQFPNILNFRKRYQYLKKFYVYSKDFGLSKNIYLSSFFEGLGRKTRYFYQLLFFFEHHRLFCFANSLISMYQYLKKKYRVVSLVDVSLDDLKHLAEQQQKLSKSPVSISVVIPNYNYEQFLLQRIGTILRQKVSIHELILLDDCSTDHSRDLIDQIETVLSPYLNIVKVYNKKNSGSAFKQWEKGFSHATGDYVWICEADDYCNDDFLEHVVAPILTYSDVVISYCDTAMIDGKGNVIASSVVPMIDERNTGHYKKRFLCKGTDEMKEYTFLNCTIANVSSALIRNGDYAAIFKEAKKYKQAGDWVFYLQVMQLGNVAYESSVCNYYRIHGNNVTSVTKKNAHFEEIQQVHQFVRENFSLTEQQEAEIAKRYLYLKEMWNLKDE